MNTLKSILIKAILAQEDEKKLRTLFIAVSNILSGWTGKSLTEADQLDYTSATIIDQLGNLDEKERKMVADFIRGITKGREDAV